MTMTNDEADVLEAEARRQKALIAVDMLALNSRFADDLTHVHTNGLMQEHRSWRRPPDPTAAENPGAASIRH
jgi:hypothetical protein